MDRDDPTRRPITTKFEDEAFDEQGKDSQPVEEDEWQELPTEEPIDDFADPEQAYAEEQVETNQGTELHSYADEEGPAEDDFVAPQNEDEYLEEGEGGPSAARAKAEGYLPKGMGGSKPSYLKYLPYGAGALVLLVLGFFGFQTIQGMMANHQDAGMTPPPLQEARNTPVDKLGIPADAQPSNNSTPLASQAESTVPEAQQQVQPQTPPVNTVTQSPQYILQPDGTQKPIPPGGLPPEALGLPPGTPVQQQAQQPVQQPNPLEGQVAALSLQLEDMKKSQAQLQEQLQKAQSTPPADMKAMQDKVADLEQRLSAVQARTEKAENAPVHKKTSVIAKPSNKDEDLPPPVSDTYKPARVKSAHRAKDKTYGNSEASRLQREMNARYGIAGSNSMPPQGMGGPMDNGMNNGMGGPLPTGPGGPAWQDNTGAPVMAVNAAGGGWILRSAQPGSAWLSQGMSSDLTRVVPGDKIPGLGTIVSVRMVGGHWLVEGTQGSVR